MKKFGLLILALATFGGGCDKHSQQSATEAERCAAAVNKGLLNVAEEACHSALLNAESAQQAPAIQSERLYELGRVMRQRGKYVEAEPLLRQALALEKAVSGHTSPAYGRRLLELSLILAGQAQWAEGAVFLEPILQIADRLPEREQLAAANVLKHYALRLRHAGQTELANRFKLKATELRTIKQSDAGQTD